MKKSLYIFSLICCLMLFFVQNIALAASDTATIDNIRISNNKDKVRIVVDADKEVDYQVFALESPNRVVIDLSDAVLDKSVAKEINVDSDFVSKVRIAQFKDNVVRVVVESDMKKGNYDIFGIGGGNSHYRVAMDFGNLSGNSNTSNTDDNKNNKDDKDDNKAQNNNTDYKIDKDFNIDSSVKSILKGKKITIDPGHGGSDSGAIGPTGLYEKTATLHIGLNLAEMLKESGAKVYITRKTDKDVAPQPATDVEELQSRVDVANNSDSDIFVSIHLDSFTAPSAKGTTGYYYVNGSSASERLATYIKEGVIEQIGTVDRGTKTSNFYVVKHTAMPATLLEVAFVSNPDEEAILASDEGAKKAAVGIFNGIVRFFSES